MPNIAIPHVGGAIPVRLLADAIAGALGQADCNARLIDVEVMFRIDWDALEASDAIVLGAPSVMGSASAAFAAFMADTADIAARQGWADKVAAGFTLGDGDAAALPLMSSFAARHGMVWLGTDPEAGGGLAQLGLACPWRADAPQAISTADLDRARHFGARIARAVRRWSV